MWCLSLLAFLSGKQVVCRQVLWKYPRHYTTCGTLKQQESNLAVKQAWRTGLRICWNINICWRKPGGPREPESGLKQAPVFIGQGQFIGSVYWAAAEVRHRFTTQRRNDTIQMLPMWPTMNSSGSSRCALTHHSAVKPDKWRSSHGTKIPFMSTWKLPTTALTHFEHVKRSPALKVNNRKSKSDWNFYPIFIKLQLPVGWKRHGPGSALVRPSPWPRPSLL